MKLPLVTVLIPTFNRAHIVKRAIYSVLTQTHMYDNLEVLIIDDGSTDNTEKVIQGIRSDKITYIKQENRGVAAARNAGMRLANGKYIALLDSDDIMRANTLAYRTMFLEGNPNFDAIIGSVMKLDNNFQVSGMNHEEKFGNSNFNSARSQHRFDLLLKLSNASSISEFHTTFREYLKYNNGSIPYTNSAVMFNKESKSKFPDYPEKLISRSDLPFLHDMSKNIRIKYEYLQIFAYIIYQETGISKLVSEGKINNHLKEALNLINLEL